MSCRKCGVHKPRVEFYDGKSTCKTCLAAYFRRYYRTHTARKRAAERQEHEHEDGSEHVREIPRSVPPPAAIYVKAETFYHARCEAPLLLIGYLPSNNELHFRCQPCRESVFLPTVAVERLATR